MWDCFAILRLNNVGLFLVCWLDVGFEVLGADLGGQGVPIFFGDL